MNKKKIYVYKNVQMHEIIEYIHVFEDFLELTNNKDVTVLHVTLLLSV